MIAGAKGSPKCPLRSVGRALHGALPTKVARENSPPREGSLRESCPCQTPAPSFKLVAATEGKGKITVAWEKMATEVISIPCFF